MSGGTLATMLLCAAVSGTLGQSSSDIVFTNQRNQSVPVNFPEARKAEIRELLLFASQDQGESWSQVGKITPDQKRFLFAAPVDGAYWLRVAVVDRNGRQDPENLYKVQPNVKMVIDSLRPLVKITSAQRVGNEVRVAWEMREDNPEWSTFRIDYHLLNASPQSATAVTAAPGLTGQAAFTPNTNGSIVVRLILKDKADNESIATQEVRGLDGVAASPQPVSASTLASNVPPSLPTLPASITPKLPEAAPLPAELTQAPLPPANTAISAPPAPKTMELPPLPPPVAQGGTVMPGNPSQNVIASNSAPKTLASATAHPPVPLAPVGQGRWSSNNTVTNYAPAPVEKPIASTEFPQPAPVVAAQYHVPTPTPGPRKALPPLQYVNSPEVVLEYELSKVGPSGVGSVDIFLSQDEGTVWEHVATDPAVIGKTTGGRHQGIVELPGDGIYGFTLVVRSQAQLKQDLQAADKKSRGPRSGEVPEIRVEIDTVPPTAELFPPRRDTSKANSLLLVWTAADKNLGSNPITLEWAERREGPWLPIASNLPNLGKHSWQLPDRLPVQVYMRIRVKDLASNEGVAVTPEPQLVDLSEPEGRLVNVSSPPRRQ